MSRYAFNPEISSSANFTPSGGEAAATTAIDAHRAEVFQPAGVESHVAAAVPGAEQGIMSAVQAASQPISPLIQMIMRMPGQIGLMSSMFEALGNFLFGHANLLAGFDPSILAGAQSALTSLPGSEHLGISMSLLPHNAPILQNLHGFANFGNLGNIGNIANLGNFTNQGGDIIGNAARSAGQFNTHDILKDSIAFRDQLKVSGTLDLSKPQFEAGRMSAQMDAVSGAKGEALSGPAMHEAGGANHLAGANRLFGDRPVGLTSHTPMANTQAVAQAQAPVSGQAPSSMNVNGSSLNADMTGSGSIGDAPVASGAQNVGGFNLNQIGKSASDAGSLGPSGAVGDQLGANKFVAMDKGVANFHPTLGSPDAGTAYDASYLQHQAPTADAGASHNLGGLKANQLSLDSVTGKTHVVPNAAQSASHAAPAAHSTTASHASTSQLRPSGAETAKPAVEQVAHHAKPAADVAHHAKPVMDHIGHQTAGSAHHHSSAFSGRDGIAHINRTPAHVEQPKLAAQPQQMFKPQGATNVSFEQQAVPAQQYSADGQQLQAGDAQQMQAQDAGQVQDGTQLAQAGDASQQMPGVDAAQTAPAGPTTYTIRAGDCLWNIAKDHLGAPTRWSELYKMNADVLGSNPSMIHPGTNIQLPGSGSEIASGAGVEHGTYIVKAGDNLWDISKHTAGDGSKWGEIYKLNKDIIGSNPSLIMPGQHLQLPGVAPDTTAGTLAQAPASAASQQLASVPQASSAPTAAPTGGDALRMEGGTPIAADGTLAQTPVQSYTPAELQAQAPAAAPEAAMEMPQTPAAQAAAMPTAAAPAQAAAAAPQNLGGPGAAAAATLPPAPSAADMQQLAAPKDSVVSSNLTADLAQFIRKAKN